MLRIDPADSVPIWKQIEEGVRHLIASGALGPNDPVPSVREQARELRVNPLTVSKAYRRLVDLDVLVVRRGEGTFVSASPPRMAEGERHQKLHDAAQRYTSYARTLGANREEIIGTVRRCWEDFDRESNQRLSQEFRKGSS